MRIGPLLSVVGLKRAGRPFRTMGFWVAHDAELIGILHDAHLAWRRSLKRYHPDRPATGRLRRSIHLNHAWERILRLFARRNVRPGDWPARPD